MDLHDLRKQYEKNRLDETELDSDPFGLFRKWFQEAREKLIEEPNAMVLSTVSLEGKPSARVVLLKAFHENGFEFFTNYESRKGRQLAGNPYASLTFFWPQLERQIRIEGKVEKVPDAVSDQYFGERPLESRISAIVSPQSQRIPSRDFLENAHRQLLVQANEGSPERPPYWGGYVLIPELIEFWQGRPNRLHDRMEYVKIDGKWELHRLAP